jgi:hypothetical protein
MVKAEVASTFRLLGLLDVQRNSQLFQGILQRGELMFGDGDGCWAEPFSQEVARCGVLAEAFEQVGVG